MKTEVVVNVLSFVVCSLAMTFWWWSVRNSKTSTSYLIQRNIRLRNETMASLTMDIFECKMKIYKVIELADKFELEEVDFDTYKVLKGFENKRYILGLTKKVVFETDDQMEVLKSLIDFNSKLRDGLTKCNRDLSYASEVIEGLNQKFIHDSRDEHVSVAAADDDDFFTDF